ncbi:MAG: sugar transferase [Sphingomonas sp.]
MGDDLIVTVAQKFDTNAVRFSEPRALVNKTRVRAGLYLILLLVDCAAIRTGFSVGVSLRGSIWLAPNGVELGWLILPIHLLVALRIGALGIEALQNVGESIRRSVTAFFVATSLISMLIFFQYAGPLVSRLAFGASIVSTIAFLAIFRAVVHFSFIAPLGGRLVGELLIVDGVAAPDDGRHVFDATAAGFAPDLNDPNALSWLAEVVEQYDRVVVSCTPEKRQAWALILKAYNVTGEILLDQGSPLGAIALARYRGSDTALVSRGPMSLVDRIKKRGMDLALAGLALLVLAPLLLAVAVAIKLDSRGPVLFSQVRLGRGNRRFNILKFRSMRVQEMDPSGSRSATRDDERITRVGRFIRRTSIDELPQLINVLKGEMSIVGPRPHALGSLAGDKLFWEVSQKYWLRHTLKPGITGLAQVRGYRGATDKQVDLENRLQSDLEYVQGWRLWRDVSIMVNTAFVLVHAKAY